MGSRVEVNVSAAGRLCKAPEVVAEVRRATEGIAQRANAASAGFRTGLYHREHLSPAVGNTQPYYAADVQVKSHAAVGIAYTANYAAMRDNHENNTLLKSIG